MTTGQVLMTLTVTGFLTVNSAWGMDTAKPVVGSVQTDVAVKVLNVKAFGAVGDGVAKDTAPIQAAINACSKNGGGIVLLPPGSYHVGTLRMQDNVELRFDDHAVMLGSQSLADYADDIVGAIEAPAFNKCLIYAEKAKNLKFTGKGLVDARGTPKAFPTHVGKARGERPMLMRLVECENVTFKELTFKNSASWGLHMLSSRKLLFDGIRIESQDNNSNNDGIDLDGCADVLIENSVIHSGDDAICPKSTTARLCTNIEVRNCEISSRTAGFKLGTSSLGGFAGIRVRECRFYECPMGVFKLLLVDGGLLDDLLISDISMDNVGGPIFIRLGNRGRRYDKPTEQVYAADQQPEGVPVGILRNVTFKNIKARVSGDMLDRQGILITGIPGYRIENVGVENVSITFPGGGSEKDAGRKVAEDVARYPEQFFFGILPASSVYVRHVKGLSLKNLDIRFERPDARPPIVSEDVEGLEISGVTIDGTPYQAPAQRP